MKTTQIVAFLITGAVLVAIASWYRTEEKPLPVLSQLQAFELKDQEGASFGLEKLKGKVGVINFIFTTCPSICPLLTQQMREIEKNTKDHGPALQFVSISVDPDTDTPEVLRKYAAKFDVDLSRWSFLTGNFDSVSKVVIEGFKTAMAKMKKPNPNQGEPDIMEITHGEHFVLVDRAGAIRDYQTVKTDSELRAFIGKIETLLKEPTTPKP